MNGQHNSTKSVIARIAVILAATATLATGLAAPASAYETPEMFATSGEFYISQSWGYASYSRTSSTAKVTKLGYYMGIRAKWREFGVTGWTSKTWNDSVYGGTASVNCYVCQSLRISH